MKVSEMAQRAGVAASAVRYYEAEGILPSPRRTPAGYRHYDETDVCRLRVLVTLRSLGIDLHEAGRLATTCAEGRCDDMATDLLPRIVARRTEVARARAELDHLDAELGLVERTLRSGATNLGLCERAGAFDDSSDGDPDDSDGAAGACCGRV